MKVKYYGSTGRFLILLISLFLALGFASQPVFHGEAGIPYPVIVTNLNDDGIGSLRAAIDNAVPGDTIIFDSDLSGTITLTRELYIQKSLQIAGPGSEVISISGNGATNIFRIIRDIQVSISGLSLINGTATKYPGGGIANDGTLSLVNVNINHNSANTFGGGVYNSDTGTLTIQQSQITENEALGYGELAGGGGIWNDGNLTLNYVYVAGNVAPVFGGGLYNDITGHTEINYSQINENYIYGVVGQYAWGGGIYNQGDYNSDPPLLGEVIIRYSQVMGNIASGTWSSGGGISNIGSMTLDNVSVGYNVSNGVGGGIDNEGALEIYQSSISFNSASGEYGDGGGIETSGALTVIQSDISNNTAGNNGGGIDKWIGTAYILNTTISGNTADADGGGIFNYSHILEIANSTITANTADNNSDGTGSGGGIFHFNQVDEETNSEFHAVFNQTPQSTPTYVNLQNSILAGNTDTGGETNDCGVDQEGTLTSLGNNVIQDIAACPISGAATDDIYNTNAELFPLNDNGGPTASHYPKVNSPVLDAANSSACPEVDQRGASRPEDGNNDATSICDIGSIEARRGPNPNNWAPFANTQIIYTYEDYPAEITLTGADPEGDTIEFAIVANPSNGTISGTLPNVVYSPNLDFFGEDTFSFKVTDSNGGTATAAITINVLPINDTPAVDAGPTLQNIEGFPITLQGSYLDVDEIAAPYILWDFGDGSFAEGELNPTHLFPDDGNYLVTLYVVDSYGAVGVDQTLVIVEPRAELSISLVPSDDPALSGAPFIYSLIVSNSGPSAANNVIVEDFLPEDLIFVSSSPECMAEPVDPLFPSGQIKVTCQIANILPGANYVLEINTRIPEESSGTISNSASVQGLEHDTIDVDNTATSLSQVTPILAIYCNDFEAGAGQEWNNPSLSITPTGRIFLGEFSNQAAILTLSELPTHTAIKYNFDLYLIRSWDGNELFLSDGQIVGPDQWRMAVDGTTQLVTSFANWVSLGQKQAFPGIYPYASYPAQFASSEQQSLGYTINQSPMDSVYQMSYITQHTGDEFKLELSASGLQPITDESWGVDNLCIFASYSAPMLDHSIYIPWARK